MALALCLSGETDQLREEKEGEQPGPSLAGVEIGPSPPPPSAGWNSLGFIPHPVMFMGSIGYGEGETSPSGGWGWEVRTKDSFPGVTVRTQL